MKGYFPNTDIDILKGLPLFEPSERRLSNLDLGKTKITNKIRVSSAAIYYRESWGERYQLETWIFSEDKELQKSRQIIHCSTYDLTVPQKLRDKVTKIHNYISNNLIKRFDAGKI